MLLCRLYLAPPTLHSLCMLTHQSNRVFKGEKELLSNFGISLCDIIPKQRKYLWER